LKISINYVQETPHQGHELGTFAPQPSMIATEPWISTKQGLTRVIKKTYINLQSCFFLNNLTISFLLGPCTAGLNEIHVFEKNVK